MTLSANIRQLVYASHLWCCFATFYGSGLALGWSWPFLLPIWHRHRPGYLPHPSLQVYRTDILATSGSLHASNPSVTRTCCALLVYTITLITGCRWRTRIPWRVSCRPGPTSPVTELGCWSFQAAMATRTSGTVDCLTVSAAKTQQIISCFGKSEFTVPQLFLMQLRLWYPKPYQRIAWCVHCLAFLLSAQSLHDFWMDGSDAHT